jgi:uncharacterized protein
MSAQHTATTRLVVIQPTPFCNLDCTYCYLPDRSNRARMTAETLDRICAQIRRLTFRDGVCRIAWHAGEPLAAGRGFYEQAFDRMEASLGDAFVLEHNITTNATLIDDAWAAFLARRDVRVAVSIDGPRWLNDRHRRYRNGQGAWDVAMAGIAALKRADIAFAAICVLSRESLHHAEEIYRFFRELDPVQVGFNVDETEGINRQSSLSREDDDDFGDFVRRIVALCRADGFALRVRELERISERLMQPCALPNEQVEPLGIVTFGAGGTVATYSPEMATWSESEGGPALPALHDIDGLLGDARWLRAAREIAAGVSACRASCPSFGVCGGGAPVNKYAETGSFAASETQSCRLSVKAWHQAVSAAVAAAQPVPA